MANFGSNTVVTTGNITGGYIFGNGSQLTGLPATYSNANVAAFLPTYTGNLSGGNLAIGNNANILNDLTVGGTIYGTFAGNISGNLVVPGANTDIIFNNSGNAGASSNLQFDSATDTLELDGQANVTGNITASYFIGNGSQLTGLPASYSNANVTTLLAAFGSNTIVTTGNITGGNIIGNGQSLSNLPGANVVGAVANATFATSAATATTAGTVTTNAQPNITSVGNLSSLTVTGDSLLQGNLQVNGNVTYIASNTVTINDKFINVANNAATASAANGGGIGVGPVGAEYATWSFSDANTAWQSNIKIEAPALTTTGNVTGSYIIGDGSLLTNINAGNIVGSYGNANVATFLGTGFGSNSISTTGNIAGGNITGNGAGLSSLTGANVTGTVASATQAATANVANSVAGANVTGTVASATQAATANVANSVAGGNVSGQVANALVAGTVYTAAQPAITSVGTLTSLAVTGNITGGNVNSTFFGSGAGLSSLTGANVTGTVANATFATSAGTATSATTAGTVTTAAQPNITSVGTLSSLAVSGNITTGGILTNGYFFANGTPVTFGGGGGTYGNANVSAYLASGTNTANIITTANVRGDNLIGNLIGTVRSGTQANITQLGTLISLDVTGNINSSGNINVSKGLYVTDGNTTLSKELFVAGNIWANASTIQARALNLEGPNNFILMQGTGNIGGVNNLVTNFATVFGNANIGGILTDNYYYANGTPVSFGSGSYGNANVNTLLAAWGSNTLSTTGNITGGNLITNGAGGNITGVNNIFANVANIAGNVITGGINTNNYRFANGVPVSFGGTYGDSNVVTLMSSFGSNTISTTGNVTVGNLNMTGRVFDTSGVFQVNAAGNIVLVPTGTTQIESNTTVNGSLNANIVSTTGNIDIGGNINMNGRLFDTSGVFQVNSIGNIVLVPTGSVQINGPTDIRDGKLTTGAVTYANTDGTAGQVLTTYGNGVTYFSTVSGGSGSPGGANTQLQFNNGGAFAGNVAMTFNNVTGNIGFGNLLIGNTGTSGTFYNVLTNPNAYLGNTTTMPLNSRILVGSGRNGDWGATTAADFNSNARGARMVVADAYIKTDTGLRSTEVAVLAYADLNAGNIGTANTNSRIQGLTSEIQIVNGNSLQTAPFINRALVGSTVVGNTGGGGNANVASINSVSAVNIVNQGSFVVNSVGTVSQTINQFSNATSFGNVANIINYTNAYALNNGGNAAVYLPQNVVGYFNPGPASRFGIVVANTAPHRVCANYYAFLNDDDIAFSGLGSLRAFHEFQATDTIASGVLAVNKLDGQVQYVNVTENITSVTFSNFVTRVTAAVSPEALPIRETQQADTVTLILRQDSTGRTVTMPSGSAFKYAGGANVVGTTANSVTMISVTGIYNATTAATEYLITISPEFS